MNWFVEAKLIVINVMLGILLVVLNFCLIWMIVEQNSTMHYIAVVASLDHSLIVVFGIEIKLLNKHKVKLKKVDEKKTPN